MARFLLSPLPLPSLIPPPPSSPPLLLLHARTNTFENVHVCVWGGGSVIMNSDSETPKITISHQLRVPMKMAMDKENPPNPFYYQFCCCFHHTGCSMALKCHTHIHTQTLIYCHCFCPPPGVHLWFIHIKRNHFSRCWFQIFKLVNINGKEM